jgi:acetylornithine deacetylase/succinyl-diaminopimelate desuccinylase-like protein
MRFPITLLALLIFCFGQTQDSIQVKSKVRKSIDMLGGFVSIPNDALDIADINRNITWLTEAFNQRGFNSSVLPTSGAPLFFAALPMEDSKPTILFYMHLDGQGVDASKWDQNDPYQMVIKAQQGDSLVVKEKTDLNSDLNYDWRLFGRSTADDKGPIVMFLNAIDLLQENGVELAYNIKVILDSEEEKGSKPLPKAVAEYKELLQADFLVINDGPMHASGQPTIIYGCRGITGISLTTYGPIKPQHSGHYGNYTPNPAMELSQLLASMKDAEGRVTIKGYYDGIKIDEATKTLLEAVPDDVEAIKASQQLGRIDQVGQSYQEALQYPSLNIRGMQSAWVGDQTRTIVPDKATAEIGIRLVPETDGARLQNLIQKHISYRGYTVLDHEPSTAERTHNERMVKLTKGSITNAFRTNMNNPNGQFLRDKLAQ